MKRLSAVLAAVFCSAMLPVLASAEEITVGTINNGDMIIMQKLSSQFEQETGIKINWVVLEENVLRQRMATDIATGSGQFDVFTVNAYQTQIWSKLGWLAPLDDFGDDYDYDDLIPEVRTSFTRDDTLYGVPFYGESSFTFYRTDLFDAAGIDMPDRPTFDQIAEYAKTISEQNDGVYGICLRGKPGWGENTLLLSTFVRAHGGEWFNMDWEPQLTSPEWKETLDWYLDVMQKYGPPGATSNGYNENRALFATGKCGMWIDATVTAGYLLDPKESQVSKVTGFTGSPVTDANPHASGWGGAAIGLAIPASTKHLEAAKKFVEWATNRAYVELVGNTEGWLLAPPGTRLSTYNDPRYLKVAPFAEKVLTAIRAADPSEPAVRPVPYTGAGFVEIPEFQGIGINVGQNIAGALAGQFSADEALERSQEYTESVMRQAGYLK